MTPQTVEMIKAKCLPYYGGTSHGFDHAERVARMCRRLALEEGYDGNLAEACGYLHDVARQKEREGEVTCHAREGSLMSRDILEVMGVKGEDADAIASAISTHRVRSGLAPEGWLGKILQDADRLDALGAIAIARVFARAERDRSPLHDETREPKVQYDGESTTAINHFFEKILKLTPDTFHTETAKRLAEDRHAFVEGFVKRFLEEWNS